MKDNTTREMRAYLATTGYPFLKKALDNKTSFFELEDVYVYTLATLAKAFGFKNVDNGKSRARNFYDYLQDTWNKMPF